MIGDVSLTVEVSSVEIAADLTSDVISLTLAAIDAMARADGVSVNIKRTARRNSAMKNQS